MVRRGERAGSQDTLEVTEDKSEICPSGGPQGNLYHKEIRGSRYQGACVAGKKMEG